VIVHRDGAPVWQPAYPGDGEVTPPTDSPATLPLHPDRPVISWRPVPIDGAREWYDMHPATRAVRSWKRVGAFNPHKRAEVSHPMVAHPDPTGVPCVVLRIDGVSRRYTVDELFALTFPELARKEGAA
jgi:hypothetical protein